MEQLQAAQAQLFCDRMQLQSQLPVHPPRPQPLHYVPMHHAPLDYVQQQLRLECPQLALSLLVLWMPAQVCMLQEPAPRLSQCMPAELVVEQQVEAPVWVVFAAAYLVQAEGRVQAGVSGEAEVLPHP